jgi:hypothetical protein
VADYEAAEQRVLDTGRDLLIYYDKARHKADPSMEKALKSPPLEELTGRCVRCRLFKSHEPDRRYVAQFGVDRTPALIIVHADGTYHARTGSLSSAQMATFLAGAVPPGAQPRIDRYLPRQPRYRWHRGIDAAEEVSRRTQRPILIVYHRALSRDWSRLEQMLTRREVYGRFGNLVHCRIGTFNPWIRAYITRFGALQLPALVVLRCDGTFETLELPASYASVVRFADAALGAVGPSEAGVAGSGLPDGDTTADGKAAGTRAAPAATVPVSAPATERPKP